MALNYKDQVTVSTDAAWIARVYACACDVAQSVIVPADEGSASYAAKRELAAQVCRDSSQGATFARLVAAGFGSAVTAPATPIVDTGTDAQIKVQVTAAFKALVR